mmetsp:Transcript_12866/g.32950  ORF Transcript_12866/g.32950 Transcript_12866/m.32950 type:complete len:235 (+) Transcript_12866:104-808(+)
MAASTVEIVLEGCYLTMSSLFFCAAAYAQLNDPDPVMWIAMYLCGGPVLALYSFMSQSTASPTKITASKWAVSGRDIAIYFGTLLVAFSLNVLRSLRHKVAAAAAASADGTTPEKLLTHAGQHHLAASLRHLLASGWKLLEHEEGRELAGLTMLLLHTLAVFAELHSRVRNGLAFRSATARALKMSLVALLTGAIYLWVVHQRELNAKYAEPHCGGQLDFASVDQGDPGTTKGS